MTKKEIGNLGEDLAIKFLKKKNYLILIQNYYIKGGEIDIVAQDLKNMEIVFVEVKTRTSNEYGWPEEAVTPTKKQHLIRAGEKYLKENKYDFSQDYRFDIISVELDFKNRKAKFVHMECV